MIPQVVAALAASLAYGIVFQIRGKNLAWAAVGGGIGYYMFLFLPRFMSSQVIVIFFASCAITVYAEIMARARKSPATVFLVAGLIPIVPGRGMYRCMFLALEGDLPASASTLYQTLLEAGAIAIGVVTVSSLVRILTGWRKLRSQRQRQ